LILLLEEGKSDIMGSSFETERQIQTSLFTRGYGGPGPRNNFRRFELDIASWNPKFSVRCYPDMGYGKLLVSERQKSRTHYEIFAKPAWNPSNTNDDHGSPKREDYSVEVPIMLGDNGVMIEKNEESTERYQLNLKARYIQLKIENEQGFLNIRAIMPDAFEDQRAPRPQT